MSLAVPRHPSRSYRLTFRCLMRQFFLLPCPEVNQTIGYWLGVTSQRHGILVHSYAVMSNHIHLDVTDLRGRLSNFRQDFKGVTGRALNVHWGRSEYLWAPGNKDGITEVRTSADAALGIAYTICNPVKAELTASPASWPGLCTIPSDLPSRAADARMMTFKRPQHFFRTPDQGGEQPDEVSWSLAPHPLGAEDPDAFVKSIRSKVEAAIERTRARVKASSGRFKGAAAVLRRKWYHSPNTSDAASEINPKIAAKNTTVRLAMIAELQEFRRQYATARIEWLGTGQAEFPAGTNQLRDYPGVTVRAGP